MYAVCAVYLKIICMERIFVFQEKRTPLHLAARCGQLDVCETLLNMKADANAIDEVMDKHRIISDLLLLMYSV